MTNRHERRVAARKHASVIFISWGHLLERDPSYGLQAECYVCATPHRAHGLARIEHGKSTTNVLLCEECLASDGRNNAVLRKYSNLPDLEIREGGKATTEQVIAVAEKSGATEH